MREILNLNSGWRFSPDFKTEYTRPDFKDTAFKLVDLPHSIATTAKGYVSERQFRKVTCYRKMFILPEEMKKRRLMLRFDGVANCAAVFVNGKPVYAHKGGFTPFSCDVTSDISEFIQGGDNLITVVVDSTEREDTAPFGGRSDMLYFGGMYREVYLEALDDIFIEDVFVRPIRNGASWKVDVSGKLSGPGAKVTVSLKDGYRILTTETLFCRSTDSFYTQFVLNSLREDMQLWKLDDPKLYTMNVTLDSGDEYNQKFGFRTAEFRPDGFYLNFEKVRLVGLTRNQSYPRTGWAMPASAQRMDADLIKELGCNMVRTQHCPPSKHFLDRCDEIGIMVLDEMPGYRHVGGSDWQDCAVRNLEELIIRDRNHPSVIMWSTRVEEAEENSEFFRRTAEIARSLDGSRPITGIRNVAVQEIEEDVFCFNDYGSDSSNGVEKKKNLVRSKLPFLTTAHTGIRYPAKENDSEKIRLEQALRHARALDAAFGDTESCGVIGCSLTDTNAPRYLGSADNICYYGVTDIGRVKKLAAYVYQSQSDTVPVMELSSALAGGDNENSICTGVYAFTNCDSIRVLRSGTAVGEFFPDRKKYPNLPHPPIYINDLIGDALAAEEDIDPKDLPAVKAELLSMQREGVFSSADVRSRGGMSFSRSKMVIDAARKYYDKYVANCFGGASFTFEGIRNGEVVRSIVLEPVVKTGLKIECSSEQLVSNETYDCIRLELTAVDQNGNRLYDCNDAVNIDCEGSVEIIGSKLFALSGGAAAVYVRSKGGKGAAKLKIQTESLGKHVIGLDVVRTSKRDL